MCIDFQDGLVLDATGIAQVNGVQFTRREERSDGRLFIYGDDYLREGYSSAGPKDEGDRTEVADAELEARGWPTVVSIHREPV